MSPGLLVCEFKAFLKKSQGLQSIKFTIDYPLFNFVYLGSSFKSVHSTDVAFLIGIYIKQGWTTTTRHAVKKREKKDKKTWKKAN